MHLRLFAPAALLALCAACSSEPAPAAKPATAAARAAQQYHLVYAAPELADSLDGYYYQRVSLADQDGRSSGSKYGSSDNDYTGTGFNVAFFRADGTDAHLLLPHGRWRIYEVNDERRPAARAAYLFYTIFPADTNGDGQQDGEDPLVLFASDRRGRRLQQVTPDTVSVQGWQVVAPHYLHVRVQRDADHNRQYEEQDAEQWLRYDLRNLQAPPTPLLPPALQATLQQQLIERRLHLPKEE